ncbi:hypothetical protein ETD83_08065 [Actinomadura soli]|uniref:PLD phosphodiesterase domain-containing protein n=1 Tax=Actinomadura soli TaxID=2508997 RepID=A0A5C4JG48_9ACTN|nr:phospholipase D family protein [Actinomadura soli]TMR04731.1 hypothetical protein ETD83_08065 [Actinomadura soli]
MASTDPATWFLPASQMPRFPAFTSENQVTPLVDGREYMAHLAARLAGQVSGDHLHFTGWRTTGAQALEPDFAPGVTFLDQVSDLMSRGVTGRFLIWLAGPGGSGSGSGSGGAAPASQMVENIDFVAQANNLGATAVLDNRTVSFSSHHQKTAVLSVDGVEWAYTGGIDIAPDRWDVPAHDQPSGRTREGFDAWHDVHCAVQGPAAAHVWQNFTDRWNDPTPANSIPAMPGPVVPPPIVGGPPAPFSAGTHHVQVLRTLACNVYPFGIAGEQTVRQLYERAVDNAEHYVYIEDQYLWPCTGDFSGGPAGLVNRLREATVRGVKVICVVAHRNDLAVTAPYHNQMQQDVLDLLRRDRPDNVFVFHLQTPGQGSDIYVHAKLMIVDDCLAVIGSPNISRRSQTSDSELSVAVVDADVVPGTMDGVAVPVCRFAKDLRIALWSEHLGLPDPSAVDDPIAGLTEWPDQNISTPDAPDSRHHAVCHFVDPDRPLPFLPDLRPLMNLETTCFP